MFEAFVLMRQDPDLKLHTYELTCYLVTARKTRVRWCKDMMNRKIDEMAYVELCKKQNKQKAPHDILRLM